MKKFPNIIPVFPLSGVIYFPKTNLPLNIFEQRYLNLINDAYSKDKLMGMVQSKTFQFKNLLSKLSILISQLMTFSIQYLLCITSHEFISNVQIRNAGKSARIVNFTESKCEDSRAPGAFRQSAGTRGQADMELRCAPLKKTRMWSFTKQM